MIYIQIAENLIRPDGSKPVESALLERAVSQALAFAETRSQVDVTVVLADDAQIQDLNRQFLGVDAPTDVLAFPSDEVDPDSQAPYLGDVILSYPRAQSQASAAGHYVEAELQLLVVHGVLHLLGYDHADEEQKAAMWAAQAEILARLGCSIAKLPA
jgi:probable rRNA maturation factor